jgi:hypothetical protein
MRVSNKALIGLVLMLITDPTFAVVIGYHVAELEIRLHKMVVIEEKKQFRKVIRSAIDAALLAYPDHLTNSDFLDVFRMTQDSMDRLCEVGNIRLVN